MEKNFKDLLDALNDKEESCWLDVQGLIIQAAEENNQDFYEWLQNQSENTSLEAILTALSLDNKNMILFDDIPSYFKENGWDCYTYERYADNWMETQGV